MTLRTRHVLAAVAVGVAALAASGCGGVDAGAAAIVDGRRVSVDDVQTATVQVNRIVSQDAQFDQRNVLSFLITEPFLVAEASRRGVGVSESDARAIFRQFNFTDPVNGGSAPAAGSLQLVRGILALNLLQGRALAEGDATLPPTETEAAMTAITEQLKTADITVNPRYGEFTPTFDVASQQIFPVDPEVSNWLVPAAEQPQPTPSP